VKWLITSRNLVCSLKDEIKPFNKDDFVGFRAYPLVFFIIFKVSLIVYVLFHFKASLQVISKERVTCRDKIT